MIDRLFALWPEALPSELSDSWSGPTTSPIRQSDLVARVGGVGYLSITGTMTHARSRYRWSDLVSYDEIVAALQQLQLDPEVSRVLISLDSPGGTVSGASRASQALRDLARAKPVVVHTPAVMASAAVHLAAHATKIVAADSAIVGSVGTFAVLADYSKLFSTAGIEMHLISSGGLKGKGSFGLPVTQDLKDQQQRLVDYFALSFLNTVQAGRKLTNEEAQAISGGYVWVGAQAKNRKLIDALGSIEDALSMLLDMPAPKTRTERYAIDDEYLASRVDEAVARIAFDKEVKKLGADAAILLPKSHARFNPSPAKFLRKPVT